MLSGCQNINRLGPNGISWSPRKNMVKDLRHRSGLAWVCACAESCVVFNTGSYTVLADYAIFITANMQSETGFLSSHQLKSYVASKSRLKLAARAVLSADGGLLVQYVKSQPSPFWILINCNLEWSIRFKRWYALPLQISRRLTAIDVIWLFSIFNMTAVLSIFLQFGKSS